MAPYATSHYKSKATNHEMDNKQQEFIYSTHLWGGLFNLGKKQSQTTSSTNISKKVPQPQNIETKDRKESGHEWDHEQINIHQFGIRKMSEDENINAFGPFGSLI